MVMEHGWINAGKRPEEAALRRRVAKADTHGAQAETANPVLRLQRLAGNEAVTSLLSPSTVQREQSPTTTAAPIAKPDVAEKEGALPAQDIMEQIAMQWVQNIWNAQNQGLNDFVKDSDVPDWPAFWLTVAGNILWAAACFVVPEAAVAGAVVESELPVGAFLTSLGGIAVSTTASAGTVKGQDDVYNQMRADIDALFKTLKDSVGPKTKKAHAYGAKHGWDASETWRQLMRMLLRKEFVGMGESVPVVDSPKVAALVEQQLFLKLGSTKSKSWAGWEHGNWWIEYNYHVHDAFPGLRRVAPVSGWKISDDGRVMLLPIDTDIRNARNHLNRLHKTLGPMRVRDWPLRKVIHVWFDHAGAIDVSFTASNKLDGFGVWYMKDKVPALKQATGWSDVGAELARLIWARSSGAPPDIDHLD